MKRETGEGSSIVRGAAAGALVVFFSFLSAVSLSACGGAGERGAEDSASAMAPAPSVVDSATAAGTPTSGETSALPQSRPDAAGSFKLAGNEPFWSVRIGASGLTYTTPDYPKGIAFPSTAPEAAGTTLRWVALTPPPEAHTLEVTLDAKPCQDTMADKTWSHTATVVFDGTRLSGCGERVP